MAVIEFSGNAREGMALLPQVLYERRHGGVKLLRAGFQGGKRQPRGGQGGGIAKLCAARLRGLQGVGPAFA